MIENIPEFKFTFARTVMESLLLDEKGSYRKELESFENYSKHKLSEAELLDAEFSAQIMRGARLVHEHFLRLEERL